MAKQTAKSENKGTKAANVEAPKAETAAGKVSMVKTPSGVKIPTVADKPKAAKANGKGKASKSAAPECYADILKVTSAPVDERSKLAIGRKGEKVVPRRFHLEADKLAALKAERAENPKAIPNPHNVGAYWLFVEALKSLGANKGHPFKLVKAEMKRLGSAAELKDDDKRTLWERFANKEGKAESDENNLSLDGRIHQNAEVLQRLGGFTPYGLKLLQVGQLVLKSKGLVVDVLKGKSEGEVLYRLNANADTPTNELRRQRTK